jgi:hypothetical protein
MAEAAKKRLRKDFKNLQVYSKVGMQIFFVSLHIANPRILGLILQSQIRICGVPVRKLQIANPQISLVSQSANLKSANFEGKKQCF